MRPTIKKGFKYYIGLFIDKVNKAMVTITPEAVKYINDLLAKNNKQGYGIRIYLQGMGCSGPQFGMSFQEAKKETDMEQKSEGFSLFYDDETSTLLQECAVDFIETPYGSGLIVNNPNAAGCDSCGGSCH